MKAMIFEKVGITAMVLAVLFASGGHLGGCLLCAACCALLVHGAAVVWLNVKRRGMVEISNDKADEIMLVIGELRMMSDDVPGNRAANMRRRGVNIIKYLTKKKDGKKKEIVYPSRNDRTDDCQ